MRTRSFAQVDVFSEEPYRGNPVAVVVDGEGLSDAEMQEFARWTNLSETTFLLPTRDAAADYRVRIFTTATELPFAGHPTLGSAHAWLEAGGSTQQPDRLVQECGAGLVQLHRSAGRWAFAAPPLRRYEPLTPDVRAQVAAALGRPESDLLASSWLDNGPPWIGVRLASAADVLAVEPDYAALGDLSVGVVGAHPSGAPTEFEVRTFMDTGAEDPVTGSFNAGAARWLMDTGDAPPSYVAAQGTVLGRAGRVHITARDGQIWVGGATHTLISGSVKL